MWLEWLEKTGRAIEHSFIHWRNLHYEVGSGCVHLACHLYDSLSPYGGWCPHSGRRYHSWSESPWQVSWQWRTIPFTVFRLGLWNRWKAGFNEQFRNMTIRDARCLVGTFLDSPDVSIPPKSPFPTVDLPETFDARDQWPNAIHPIRNQVGTAL